MLEIIDQNPTLKDERSVLWALLTKILSPRGVPLFNSLPGKAPVPKFNLKVYFKSKCTAVCKGSITI